MRNARMLAVMAIFIALAIAGGLALIAVPNVELITLTVFLAGYMLGAWRGAIIGAMAEFLYSFFNPYGVAAPPLLFAQVLSFACCGMGGGLLRLLARARMPRAWMFALCGFLVTLIFDAATTASTLIITQQGFAGLLAALTFGFYFYVAHLTSNTILFAVLLPILIPRLQTLTIFRNPPRAQIFSARDPLLHAAAFRPARASEDRHHSDPH